MAGLLDGLLTGSNGGLTENVQADFRTTGLSHIVAVSGSNITVILSVLSGLLFFLPLKWRFLPCAIGIILFTLFVGASASVVRAAITGIIGLIALQSERQNDARLAMLWTAFGMLCWNPWQLWADAGFQLSFLAVAGLIELTPLLEPWLKRVPEIGGMREALTATLAAQFTAVPWGIALFGAVPLISPLSNVLVAPLIPMAMLTGSLGLLVAFVMPPLALIAGLPASLLLDAIIRAAHLLALIPGASMTVPAFPSWLMALYYILLTVAVVILKKRSTSDTAAPSHLSLSRALSPSSQACDR
jgi:competence protein ComEC